MEKHPIESLMGVSMDNIKDMVDVNTVIGKPIATSGGYQLIPVSKVTMGYLSGGGEYGEIKILKEDENYPFAGGSGAVVSLKPAGFILDTGSDCRFIHVGDAPLDNLIDKVSELMGKFVNKND